MKYARFIIIIIILNIWQGFYFLGPEDGKMSCNADVTAETSLWFLAASCISKNLAKCRRKRKNPRWMK